MHKSLLVAFLIATIFFGFASTINNFFGIVHAKPSVPEFTIRIVAHPYDIPPKTTSTIDPYTGEKNEFTTPGYTVENKSIEITITNQPFTPYNDTEGNIINLYYKIRFKGHFGNDWDELYPYEPIRNGEFGTAHKNPMQSSSEYTVVSFPLEFPEGVIVDFQVRAMEGYYVKWVPLPVPVDFWKFYGEVSDDWSSIRTLNIGEYHTPTPLPFPSWPPPTATPAIFPTPTPTPTLYQDPQKIDQTEIIIGATITIAVLGAGLGFLFYLIKRK